MAEVDIGVAYHEAGHAVVGHVLGLGVVSATIVRGEDFAGQVEFADAPENIDADERRYRQYLERRLVCSLAGAYAEGLLRDENVEYGPTDFSPGDWRDIIGYIADLEGEDPDEQQRALDEAAAQAQQVLTDNWPNVLDVAQALIEHRELSRAQLERFLPRT